MVRGIDTFKKYFEKFDSVFLVIGGTDSTLLLEEAGLEFRATKDVDVVLYVEALSAEFAETFWTFIEDGGYENIQQSTGKRLFYRFNKPKDPAYPEMVELFSRKPDAIGLREGSRLTPIPIEEEIASLSAILLDEPYYVLAQASSKLIDGLPVLDTKCLIPFKAKDWLDLSERREAGEKIDDKDIRKHRNDVFRLYQIISPEDRVSLPPEVAGDMKSFIDAMEDDGPDLPQLGIRIKLPDALESMRKVYGL